MSALSRDEIRNQLFGSMFLLNQHLAREVDLELESLDLTTKQWLLLAVLTKKFSGTEPALSEAAQVYGSSRQNVKQIALQLQSRGYLRIVQDKLDRRILRLRLTPKVQVFGTSSVIAKQHELMDRLFGGFEIKDLTQLHQLIVRWVKHLSGEQS